MSDLLGEEISHEVEGLGGFGKLEVVPEGMGKSLEHDELGIDAGAEEGAMEKRGVAEKQIPGAGDEEGRRHAMEVGVNGGKDGIFAVDAAGVFLADGLMGILRFKSAGETVESEELHGVGRARVVGQSGKEARAAGRGRLSCLRRTATSAVRMAPAEVPKMPMLRGL